MCKGYFAAYVKAIMPHCCHWSVCGAPCCGLVYASVVIPKWSPRACMRLDRLSHSGIINVITARGGTASGRRQGDLASAHADPLSPPRGGDRPALSGTSRLFRCARSRPGEVRDATPRRARGYDGQRCNPTVRLVPSSVLSGPKGLCRVRFGRADTRQTRPAAGPQNHRRGGRVLRNHLGRTSGLGGSEVGGSRPGTLRPARAYTQPGTPPGRAAKKGAVATVASVRPQCTTQYEAARQWGQDPVHQLRPEAAAMIESIGCAAWFHGLSPPEPPVIRLQATRRHRPLRRS